MSYSNYYLFNTRGSLVESKELRNSHGSAPVIWEHLVKTYQPGASWFTAIASFWKKPEKFALLSKDHQFLFRTTYGAHLTMRADFRRFVSILTPISDQVPADYANHWPSIMPWLMMHADNPEILGFGLRATSVSDDPWLTAKGDKLRDARRVRRAVYP